MQDMQHFTLPDQSQHLNENMHCVTKLKVKMNKEKRSQMPKKLHIATKHLQANLKQRKMERMF